MSYNGYGDIMAKCPYYIRESKYGITCEGMLEKTECMNKFKTEGEKQRYLRQQCSEYPNTCKIAKHKENTDD